MAYSFEMVIAGVILLGAMAAGGLAVARRARQRPPTDKSIDEQTET